MTKRSKYFLVTAGLATLLRANASYGQADAGTAVPNCNDTTMFPNPIYLTGSSAIEPTVSRLAVKIKATSNTTIIFSSVASCNGPNAIKGNTTLTGNGHYYAAGATAAAAPVIANCAFAADTKADVGVADVTWKSCLGEELPATFGEWKGPVQSMLIVVPEMNVGTTSISAEQAASIWGCGAKSGIAAFSNEAFIQQRSATSGTQIMVSKYTGLSPDTMKGHGNAATGDLVNSLLAVGDPQKAIGFVAADAYETRRDKLNAVAFRGFKQTKAYYPDSDVNSTDKANVRDGHYMIQGPLHMYAPLTAGKPSANAQKLVDWLSGAVSADPATPNLYIDIVAGIGNVPDCAMKVYRKDDGGNLGTYKPAVSCGCYFLSKIPGGKATPDGCTPCTSDAQCTGGKTCQTNFCE